MRVKIFQHGAMAAAIATLVTNDRRFAVVDVTPKRVIKDDMSYEADSDRASRRLGRPKKKLRRMW